MIYNRVSIAYFPLSGSKVIYNNPHLMFKLAQFHLRIHLLHWN